MKLIIIDLSHSLHRSLRVDEIAKLRDAQGRHTGGIYGVAKILSTIMQEYPNHLPVFVSDKGLSKRRLMVYPNYKRNAERLESQAIPDTELTTEELAQRQADLEYRDMYRSSKAYIKDICNKIGLPHIEIDGFEGDDLAAVIVQSPEVSDAVLVTDDWDWYSMIDLNRNIPIELFRAMKREKLNREDFNRDEKNIERFNLIKSTTGDGSDNIPQLAKGVGGSYAAKFFDFLLESYSYEEILGWKVLKLEEGELLESKYSPSDLADIDRTNQMRNELYKQFGNGKKINSFIEALDTTDTLQVNAELIDLRQIDKPTFDRTMEEFHEEMSKIKDIKVSMFDLIGAFGQFQITNLDVTGLHANLVRLRSELGGEI